MVIIFLCILLHLISAEEPVIKNDSIGFFFSKIDSLVINHFGDSATFLEDTGKKGNFLSASLDTVRMILTINEIKRPWDICDASGTRKVFKMEKAGKWYYPLTLLSDSYWIE